MSLVVYTVLMGSGEALNEQPVALDSSVEFVCLTDRPGLKSKSWDIRFTPSKILGDSHRSSRVEKIRGFRYFGSKRTTLFIDNSVVLTRDPQSLVERLLTTSDLGLVLHPSRLSVLSEFYACLGYRLDTPQRIREQLNTYRRLIPSVLDERPFWGGMIARNSVAEVEDFSEIWLTHVLRFSRRDQLSINAALKLSGATVSPTSPDLFGSGDFKWPVRQNGKAANGRTLGRAGPYRKYWYLRVKPYLSQLAE